jgi:DNA-binding PadR family transcriptional regulator
VATSDSLLARDVVLALIVEQPRHGWAVQRELAPGSPLGRAWTLSRQLVYRAIDNLEQEGLVRRSRPVEGEGAERVVLSPTAAGRRRSKMWLSEPVGHVRDVRTELLVKLMLRERSGLDNGGFVRLQRDRLAPVLGPLAASSSNDPVDRWRAESARATMRFLEGLAST